MNAVPERHRPTPSIEVLAQLVAEHEAGVGPAPGVDPRSDQVRFALAATRSALSSLPVPELPSDVSARWVEAVDALPTPGPAAPILGGDPVRPGLPARMLLFAAAALLAVALLSVGLVIRSTTPIAGRAAPAPRPSTTSVVPPLGLASADLPGTAAAALAARDLGPLADAELLTRCLGAAGLPGATPLGGRQVVLDGRSGVLLVLPTGVAGRLRLVVLNPECGTRDSEVLADLTVGR